MRPLLSLAAAACLIGLVSAHEHHTDKIPVGSGISKDPIDTILWLHIFIQITAWGIVFPTGMVLGMIRSRWHVPTQVVGTLLAMSAYFLGHKHKGRQFSENVHSKFANTLGFMLAVQIILGIFLRLHLERGIMGRIRRFVVPAHGILGKALPVVSWVQMVFGGIAAMGYCRDDHLGQCLAHFIMGSAFVAYGILLVILLLVGQVWLRRTGRSQEFFDSLVIAAWGCVNTFTEHRWGNPWNGNDLQHTSMGVVWWCAGLLGMWLSRTRDGRPKRNIVPAVVLVMTGWAMSSHPQELMLSTMVHTVFGYTLMAAGAARIIEISFVLKDKAGVSSKDPEASNSFQFMTPYLLFAAGFLFMGATEEQMAFLSNAGVTHVSYILLLFSAAFLLFLYVNVLIHIYAQAAMPLDTPTPRPTTSSGGIRLTSTPVQARQNRQRDLEHARAAEEFELEGLMSEAEDEASSNPSEDSGSGRRKETRS